MHSVLVLLLTATLCYSAKTYMVPIDFIPGIRTETVPIPPSSANGDRTGLRNITYTSETRDEVMYRVYKFLDSTNLCNDERYEHIIVPNGIDEYMAIFLEPTSFVKDVFTHIMGNTLNGNPLIDNSTKLLIFSERIRIHCRTTDPVALKKIPIPQPTFTCPVYDYAAGPANNAYELSTSNIVNMMVFINAVFMSNS